jgi:oligopeptide transport system substrate-binding protein
MPAVRGGPLQRPPVPARFLCAISTVMSKACSIARLGCLLLAATFIVAAGGCGRHDGGRARAAPIEVGQGLAAQQVLRRQITSSPRSLDPSIATDVPAQLVLEELFEGLTTLDEAGETAPGVAERWDESTDGLTWTFHLRHKAQWSNGAPVTAQDFVYAWRRIVDPATAAEYGQALDPIVNAHAITLGKLPPDKLGVEAPDPHTLVVHLAAPTAYFLSVLTNMYLCPLYAPAIEKWGDAWTQPGHMVSNGAFMLSEAVINGHITLARNPHYWDAAQVRLQRVTYYPIDDAPAAVSQYLAGNLDWTDRYPPSDTERLRAAIPDQVYHSPYFGTEMFGFNMDKPPFKDNPKLRRAMSMAVDRDIIARYVYHGIVTPAYDIIPPLQGYTPAIPDWAALPAEERHRRARALYREAGYSDKHPLEVVLSYPTGGADVRSFMEALAAMWRMNLGANVQLYNIQFKVLLDRLQMKQPTFYWNAWIGDFPDPFTYMQLYTKGFPQNYGNYDNPAYDALIRQTQNTADNAERYRLFHEAETMLNEDGAVLPVVFYPNTHLVKPYVKGWKDNVLDRNLSRYMYILDHRGG